MLPVKQAKARKRSPKSKRKGTPKSFADYLAGVPEHARGQLKQMRAAIRSAMPREATETISYGIPAFRRDGVIVWFAAFSKHCSLFPTRAILEAFANELKGLSTSKGTVHFPIERPLPLGLIKRMVKARVAQMKAKKRA
jgi:uncharacterized protein YdhG (YjbR/CyaY superfamily)